MNSGSIKSTSIKLILSESQIYGENLLCTITAETALACGILSYSYFKITQARNGTSGYVQVRVSTEGEFGEIRFSSDLYNYFKFDSEELNESTQTSLVYAKTASVTLELIDHEEELEEAESIVLSTKKVTGVETKQIVQKILYKPIWIDYSFTKSGRNYKVVSIKANKIAYIGNNTVIKIIPEGEHAKKLKLEDLKGMEVIVQKIRDYLQEPLIHSDLFNTLNTRYRNGLLLSGPKGSGKTTLVRVIADSLNINLIEINCALLVSKYIGDTEESIRKLFNKAKEKSPVLLVLDNLESIGRKNTSGSFADYDKKVIFQLCDSISDLRQQNKSFVIGIADSNVTIDENLRSNACFEDEIFLKPPSMLERKGIIEQLLKDKIADATINTHELASITSGYVITDLLKLVQDAGCMAVSDYVKNISVDLAISQSNLVKSADGIVPSGLKEFSFEKTNVRWSGVVGLDDVINEIKVKLSLPRIYAQQYKDAGFEGIKGIMLYGPPGTGKTLIAKAIANEFNYNFITVKGPELSSKFVGDTEEAIRRIFNQARLTAPTIIFFDEIDSGIGNRDRTSVEGPSSSGSASTVGQLLSEMDGLKSLKDVVVIGTTNRLDALDKALLRPGRFDLKLFIPPPSYDGVVALFKHYTRNLILSNEVDVKFLASFFYTPDITGAEISDICRSLFEESLIVYRVSKHITRDMCVSVMKKRQKDTLKSVLYS